MYSITADYGVISIFYLTKKTYCMILELPYCSKKNSLGMCNEASTLGFFYESEVLTTKERGGRAYTLQHDLKSHSFLNLRGSLSVRDEVFYLMDKWTRCNKNRLNEQFYFKEGFLNEQRCKDTDA
jgi:hypothetical protein